MGPFHRVLALLVSAFAAAAAAVPAWALCPTPRMFSSALCCAGGASYVYTPGFDPATSVTGLSVGPSFEGAYWALGFGDPAPNAGIDNGGHPALVGLDEDTGVNADWTAAFDGYPLLLHGHWGASHEIDGCIDNDMCMAILLNDHDEGDGYFALLTAFADGNINFSFLQPGNAPITLAPLPAANVVNVEHSGSARLSVTVQSPVVDAGFHVHPACRRPEHVLLGYRVYQWRTGPGDRPPTDLGVDSGWFGALGESVCGDPLLMPIGEDAVVPLACVEDSDIYLALTLAFESGFETTVVSASSPPIACRTCPEGTDADGDGYCSGAAASGRSGRRAAAAIAAPLDCDDADPGVFPNAPQRCDGVNNDCLDPAWPEVPAEEADHDGDGYAACGASVVVDMAADCDDASATTRPGGVEVCNGVDDDCDGLIDEAGESLDEDRDGVPGACDNCPASSNPRQADADRDGVGDVCDPCTDRDTDGFGDPASRFCPGGKVRDCADDDPAVNAGAREVYDGRDNDCDGVPDEGLDDDGDGIPNFRDRCPKTPAGTLVGPRGCGT